MHVHSTDYSICLSVRPSVCHMLIMCHIDWTVNILYYQTWHCYYAFSQYGIPRVTLRSCPVTFYTDDIWEVCNCSCKNCVWLLLNFAVMRSFEIITVEHFCCDVFVLCRACSSNCEWWRRVHCAISTLTLTSQMTTKSRYFASQHCWWCFIKVSLYNDSCWLLCILCFKVISYSFDG